MEEHLGFDGSAAFRSVGHSPDAMEMLSSYLIGVLPDNERLYPKNAKFSW